MISIKAMFVKMHITSVVVVAANIAFCSELIAQADPFAQPKEDRIGVVLNWDLIPMDTSRLDARFRVRTPANNIDVTQSFAFSTGGGGEIGLRRLRGTGPQSRRAIFSLWSNGSNDRRASVRRPVESQISRCGTYSSISRSRGLGFTCSIHFKWIPDRLYRFELRPGVATRVVQNWKAFVIEPSGREHQIGEIPIVRPRTTLSFITETSSYVSWYGQRAISCGVPPAVSVYVEPPLPKGRQDLALDFVSDVPTNCIVSFVEKRGTAQFVAFQGG